MWANGMKNDGLDVPGDSVVKNLPANVGNMSSIPDPRGSQCGGAAKPELHNY